MRSAAKFLCVSTSIVAPLPGVAKDLGYDVAPDSRKTKDGRVLSDCVKAMQPILLTEGCSSEGSSSDVVDVEALPTASYTPIQFVEGFSMDRISLFGAGHKDGRWEVLKNSLPCLVLRLPVESETTEIGLHLQTPDLVRVERENQGLLHLWPEITAVGDERTLKERLEEIGAKCSIAVSGRGIAYSITAKNEVVDQALQIVAEVMARPHVPDNAVEKRCNDLCDVQASPRVHIGTAGDALSKIKFPVKRLQQLANDNFVANHMRVCVISSQQPETVMKILRESQLSSLRASTDRSVFVTDPSLDLGVPQGYVGCTSSDKSNVCRTFLNFRLGPTNIRPAEAFAYTYFLKTMLAAHHDGSLYQVAFRETKRRHAFNVDIDADSSSLEFEITQESESGLPFSAEAMRNAISYLMAWIGHVSSTTMPKETFDRIMNAFRWATSYSWPVGVGAPAENPIQASDIAAHMLTTRGAEQIITKTVVPERLAFNHFLQSLRLEEPAVVTEGFEFSDPCEQKQPTRSRKRQLSIIRRMLSSSMTNDQVDNVVSQLQKIGLQLGSTETADFLRNLRGSVSQVTHNGKAVRRIRRLNYSENALFFAPSTSDWVYFDGPQQIPSTGTAWPGLAGEDDPLTSSTTSEFDDDLELQLATTLETDREMPGDVVFLTSSDPGCPNTFVSLHLNTPSICSSTTEFVCLKLLEKIFPLLHASIADVFPVGSVRVGLPWDESFHGLDTAINTQRFNVQLVFNAALKEKPLLMLAKALHTPLNEEDKWAFENAKECWLNEIKHLRHKHPASSKVFHFLVGFPYALDQFEEALRRIDFETFRRTSYSTGLRLLRSSTIEAVVGGWTDHARIQKLVTAIRRMRADAHECPSGQHGSECESASEDFALAINEDFQSYKIRDLRLLVEQLGSDRLLLTCKSVPAFEDSQQAATLSTSVHLQFPLRKVSEGELTREEVARDMAMTAFFSSAVKLAMSEKLDLKVKGETLTEGATCHMSWSVAVPLGRDPAEVAEAMTQVVDEICNAPPSANFKGLVADECQKMMSESTVLRSAKRQETGDALNKSLELMSTVIETPEHIQEVANRIITAPRMMFVGCWEDLTRQPEGYRLLTQDDINKIDPFTVGGAFLAVRPMHLLPAAHREAEVLQAVCQ